MSIINKYIRNDKEVVDTETGEKIDLQDLKRAFEDDLIERSKVVSMTLLELGIHCEVKIIKDDFGEPYESFNVKKGFEFNKIFRKDVNLMFENSKLSPESYAFIGRFSSSLHFPSNSVLLNNQHPTQEEMSEALGFGRTKLNNALKELEFYDVIKRKKINGKTYIFFNPFLYSTGMLSVDTYKMFRDSIYNPNKNVGQSSNK